VDIDPVMVDLSKETAEINRISEKFSFIAADVKNIKDRQIPNNTVDYITVNPPYFKENTGKTNQAAGLTAARHRVDFSLDKLFEASYKILKDGGKIAVVYRSEYLADIIYLMKKNKLEPKRLQLTGKKLFLLESAKNGGVGITIHNS
jgi:tRNA1(Val) A37 N6-methylase TrmN6